MYHMIAKMRLKFRLPRLSVLAALLWPMTSHAAELLMFERDGCVWCQRWDQAVGPTYDKTGEAERLPLRRLNIDKQNSSGVKLASTVVYTPTFVVADNGREIGRITGYINDDAFWGLLGTFVAKLEPSPPPSAHSYAKYPSPIPMTN